MRFSLVLIFLFALGCGGDSGPSDPGNGNNPPPGPTLSSVTCSLDAIADVEYEGATRPSVAFAWTGNGVMSDATETALDSAVVKMGAVRIQKFTGGTSGNGTLGSGDTSDGNNTMAITCYREALNASASEAFLMTFVIREPFYTGSWGFPAPGQGGACRWDMSGRWLEGNCGLDVIFDELTGSISVEIRYYNNDPNPWTRRCLACEAVTEWGSDWISCESATGATADFTFAANEAIGSIDMNGVVEGTFHR